MRTFVIHYPKLVDRKQALLKQLENLNIEAEWVEHWNKDDPFVSRVKELTKSPLPLGHLSAFLKRLWVYKKMVDENIQEAIIFEDDVIIHPEFKEFTTGPSHLNYLRLGIGVQINVKELEHSTKKLYRIQNPGGGEAVWATIDFARDFINNLNFDFTHDIVEYGALGTVMFGYPLCHQTSLLDGNTSSCETYETKSWVGFVKSYEYLPKWSLDQLLKLLPGSIDVTLDSIEQCREQHSGK